MTHEIYSAMVARRRSLRDSDESRYGTVRLVVQTQSVDRVVCSVIVERVGGGKIQGTRLGFASVPRRRPGGEPFTAYEILALALERLRSEP